MPGFIVGGPNSYSFVSLGLKSVLYPMHICSSVRGIPWYLSLNQSLSIFPLDQMSTE